MIRNPTAFIGESVLGATSGSVLFIDSNGALQQSNAQFFFDNVNSFLGVNQSVPITWFHVVSTTGITILADNYQGTAQGPGFLARKARGTKIAPRRAKSGDDIGVFNARVAFAVDDATDAAFASTNAGRFRFTATEDATSTNQGSKFTIATTPIGSATVADRITIDENGVAFEQGFNKYKGVTTAGWGTEAIYASGRSTGQTAAVASVATYTVGAADGSFIVSANILVTTATIHNFTATCAYTDEGGAARTLTLSFSSLAGALTTAVANAAGTVPYEGVPLHIRCKAATAITIATTGTFTTVTYNVEGSIRQIA